MNENRQKNCMFPIRRETRARSGNSLRSQAIHGFLFHVFCINTYSQLHLFTHTDFLSS